MKKDCNEVNLGKNQPISQNTEHKWRFWHLQGKLQCIKTSIVPVVLANISMGYDDIVLTKVTVYTWEHGNIAKKKTYVRNRLKRSKQFSQSSEHTRNVNYNHLIAQKNWVIMISVSKSWNMTLVCKLWFKLDSLQWFRCLLLFSYPKEFDKSFSDIEDIPDLSN